MSPTRPEVVRSDLSPDLRDQFEQFELVRAGFTPGQPYESTQFTGEFDTVRLAVWERLPIREMSQSAAAEIGTQADRAARAVADVGADPYARWETAHVALARATDAEDLFQIRALARGQPQATIDAWLDQNPASNHLLEVFDRIDPWLDAQAAAHDRVSAVLYNRRLETREDLLALDRSGAAHRDHTAVEEYLRRRTSTPPEPADLPPEPTGDFDPAVLADLPWEATGSGWVGPVAYAAVVGAFHLAFWWR